MKKIIFPIVFALCSAAICPSYGSEEPPRDQQTIPTLHDRDVLMALFSHLLEDPEFDLTRIREAGDKIVVHERTPQKTGLLSSTQIRVDIRDNSLPDDVKRDLQERNSIPDTYDAVSASYRSLEFSSNIVVADLDIVHSNRRSFRAFQEAYPSAKGWIRPYLPGYSDDGSVAAVRAGVGPSSHGAMLTAVLRKEDESWRVVWYRVAWYL